MIDFVINKDLLKFNKEFGFNKLHYVRILNLNKFEDINESKEKLNIVNANKDFLRKIFESSKVDIVLGLEKLEERDSLHYRNSGLNQVLCNLARKNNISVGISFKDILNSDNLGLLLGRIMQNVALCKKYKVNIVFATFASDFYDLRLSKDLEAFAKLIGIDKLDNAKIFK